MRKTCSSSPFFVSVSFHAGIVNKLMNGWFTVCPPLVVDTLIHSFFGCCSLLACLSERLSCG